MTLSACKKVNFSDILYSLLDVFQSLKKTTHKKYHKKLTINVWCLKKKGILLQIVVSQQSFEITKVKIWFKNIQFQ